MVVRCHSFYQKIPANLDEIVSTHDRCGDCKAAGNYAADLESMHAAKRHGDRIGRVLLPRCVAVYWVANLAVLRLGYPISLYLDARERRYVEEFNTSNFVAITKDQMKRCFHCIGPLHTP